MAQRDLLENSLNTLFAERGPGKMLYAPFALPYPVRLEQVVDPTGGSAATGWTSLGGTRGGINISKNFEKQAYNDIDQIIGTYGQKTTNRTYTITTQLAEWLDRTQLAVVWETGTATVVSTTGPTQVMVPLDSGSNDPVERRLAVVWPKSTAGKAKAYVFRKVQLGGGDKTLRFDKTDPVSPALDFLAMPEIATTIPSELAYGADFDIL